MAKMHIYTVRIDLTMTVKATSKDIAEKRAVAALNRIDDKFAKTDDWDVFNIDQED